MSLDRTITELARGEDEPQAYEAVVAKDASSVSDPLVVHIPSFDDKHLFHAIGWDPHVYEANCGASGCTGEAHLRLPQKGDRAAVITTDEGEAWVLSWWPASYG